ncbi:NADP-dependent phosphogluconate dehydrogenase [Candidatus Peregrinibacteria bacterium]|nr:NADP-dependent phosphogluconate dehydrogenase [Candidatus Peregrinibacteria bacterium]
MKQPHIGLIGLGTMGANLARNIAHKGYSIAVYNRTTSVTESFLKNHGNSSITGPRTLEEFVESLKPPRIILLMVKAGKAVDIVIDQLRPLIEKGDSIIDCGNSYFKDTKRRYNELENYEIHFAGCGVSGGEEGALNGPSLMLGSNDNSWQQLKDVLQAIAAKDFNGKPCVTHVGPESAGHYVKMVHNGIEYGIMQLMAEGYDMLRTLYTLSSKDIAHIYKQYNDTELSSYLFDISEAVLLRKDDQSDTYIVDMILDEAAQKGTGAWTAHESLATGEATPTIAEAVFARYLTGNKEKRKMLAKHYASLKKQPKTISDDVVNTLRDALYSSILLTYIQGFSLIHNASQEYAWNIDLPEIARIWQGGCIIRADMLSLLHSALREEKQLLATPSVQKALLPRIRGLRHIITQGVGAGIPLPAFSSTLAYIDTLTSSQLPANYIQGLRDRFGAHTYKRIDKKGVFHTDWLTS